MFDYRQYKRGYFMPPVECNDWVKKEYIIKKKEKGAKAGTVEYLYDDKALEKYRKKHPSGSFSLQRYKGLGEMDPEQLWETTLNPETRILKQVEIEDARLATEVTSMLMGSEVPPRKQFIYAHADEAEIDA